MNIGIVDSVFTISLDAVVTLALAALLLLGYFVKGKVFLPEKFCIPAPVVGGFIFMFISFIGHATGTINFKFDTISRSVFS